MNDAFGTAHRAHASTAIIAEFFPGKKAFGYVMAKEVAIIDNKLFLNYSSEVNELWLKELADRMKLANKNWLKREKS